MRVILFIATVFAITIGNSQTISKAKWDDLSLRMYIHVLNQLPEVYVQKESEMALVFFETDSSARISSMRIKGDPKDSIYNILMRTPLSLFDGWQCDGCINKIIIVPYFYWFFEAKHNSAYRAYKEFYAKQPYQEHGNTIITKPMVSFAPIVVVTSCPGGTPFEIITDSTIKPKPIIEKKPEKLKDSCNLNPPVSLRYSVTIPDCCFHRDFRVIDTITSINMPVHR